MNSKKLVNPEQSEIISEMMKTWVLLLVENIEDENLVANIRFIFGYKRKLHHINFQDMKTLEGFINSKQKEKFRSSLKIGDRIDAMKIDK